MADEILRALVEHAMQQQAPPKPTYAAPTVRSQPMKPETAAILGGMADAASTYAFLKRGQGTEGNPLFAPLHNAPAATGLAVAGTAFGMKALRALLRKKWPKVADALAANQGAMQLGIAAGNQTPGGGYDTYSRSMAEGRHPR